MNMRHVEIAKNKLAETHPEVVDFIGLLHTEDEKGVAPIVSFEVQSDPIGEVGVNGLQAVDILNYTKCLFQSLNDAFPCRENALTITKIEEALHWQHARTADRNRRNVEGKNIK